MLGFKEHDCKVFGQELPVNEVEINLQGIKLGIGFQQNSNLPTNHSCCMYLFILPCIATIEMTFCSAVFKDKTIKSNLGACWHSNHISYRHVCMNPQAGHWSTS